MAVRGQDTDDRPDPPRDPVLDRAYAAGAREEPPAGLDAAILAAARREVRARPGRLGSLLRAWRAPVALAAVLVLSVSVVLLLREEGADRPDEASGVAPPAADTARSPEVVVPSARPEDAPGAALLRDVAPQLRAVPASRPKAIEDDRRKAEPPTGVRESAPPAAEPSRPAPQPFAAAPAPPAELRRAAPEAPPQTRSLAKEMEPDAAAGALARPSARPGPAQQDRANRMEQTLRDDVVGAGVRTVWQGFERQPPDKWLERVEELRRSGRDEEAREMLVEFRRRFPEHPVPASLSR